MVFTLEDYAKHLEVQAVVKESTNIYLGRGYIKEPYRSPRGRAGKVKIFTKQEILKIEEERHAQCNRQRNQRSSG
jgi:hypothetical protein